MQSTDFDLYAFASHTEGQPYTEHNESFSAGTNSAQRGYTNSPTSEDPFKGWGVGESSSVRQYAHSRDMMVKAKGAKYTHTFVAGGKMCLIETPANKRDFCIAAAQPLHLNTISEEAEEEYRAYFEIDCPALWTEEHTDAFLLLVCAVMCKFCPGAFFLMYCSFKASGAPGMHLVIPDICITGPRMLKVRRYLIMLAQRNPVFSKITDWEPIVDKKVYTKGGAHMRMNFSYKAEQHHACFRGGKYSPIAGASCTNNPPCKYGFIYKVGSYYQVQRVYRADGTRDVNEEMLVMGPHMENRVKQLERTSIRHPSRILTTPFITPAECPQEIDDTSKRFQNKFNLEAQLSRTIGEAVVKYTLERSDPIFSAIVEFIRNHSGRPEWKHLEIQDIKFKLVGTNNMYRKYFVYVNPKCPGGTCCLNREPNEFGVRQHKSAPIYFELCPTGLKQRCTAGNKKANRVKINGKVRSCSDFSSNEIAIRPMSICRSIFPPLPKHPTLEEQTRSLPRSASFGMLARTNSSQRTPGVGPTIINPVLPISLGGEEEAQNDLVNQSAISAQSLMSVPTAASQQSEKEREDERQRIEKETKARNFALKILRFQDAMQTCKPGSSNKHKNFGYGPVRKDRRTQFQTNADVRGAVASKFLQSQLTKANNHPYQNSMHHTQQQQQETTKPPLSIPPVS